MKNNSIGTIVVFIITLLLGGGAVWQWQQVKLNEQSLALQKSERITGLYKRINEIDIEMVELNIKYRKLKIECNNSDRNPDVDSYLTCNEKVNVKDKMSLYSKEYTRMENELSLLENRPPREQYKIKQPPKTPSFSSVTFQ